MCLYIYKLIIVKKKVIKKMLLDFTKKNYWTESWYYEKKSPDYQIERNQPKKLLFNYDFIL